jgi:hypothetical protein
MIHKNKCDKLPILRQKLSLTHTPHLSGVHPPPPSSLKEVRGGGVASSPANGRLRARLSLRARITLDTAFFSDRPCGSLDVDVPEAASACGLCHCLLSVSRFR